MNENRLNPGDVTINAAILINNTGKGINVKNLIREVVLYENIMSPFITGEVTISDSINLAEAMPLIGEEQLFLDIENVMIPRVNALRRERLFFIYKMGGMENLRMKNRIYTLYIMSIEGFTDINQRISQTFKGKISDTVKKLVDGKSPGLASIKPLGIEETSNNEVHTSNFWSPTQNIYYLCDRAVNKKNNPNYLFFECGEGFVFSSLDTLYSQQEYITFIKDSKTRGPEERQDLSEEFNKVLDISTPVHYDYIERVRSGFYGATIYNMDIYTKRLTLLNRTENNNWLTTHDRLNEFPALSKNLQALPEAAIEFNVKHTELYDNSPTHNVQDIIKRKALLSQLSATKTNIQVFGRFDYSVGKKIKLVVYKESPIDAKTTDDKLVDEELSGMYLITSMSHVIDQKSHMTNMELCKDSYIKDIKE
jgi:hypothetical protein